jgi:purine-nucleoside phosphorylase
VRFFDSVEAVICDDWEPGGLGRLEEFGASFGMVLGSGLARLAEGLEVAFEVPYAACPGLPQPAVSGHRARFLAGRFHGEKCVIAQGRVHLYEGFSAAETARGVRTLAACGIPTVLLTNAAGGIRPDLSRGAWMLISDHINLTATSPLIGGPNFIDLSGTYSVRLRRALSDAAERAGLVLAEGVYAAVTGPQYETPAEIRMLGALGADAVGMSTVPEAIAARALGMEVCGLSFISNLAAGLGSVPLDHAEVLAAGESASKDFQLLLGGAIEAFSRSGRGGGERL